MDGLGNGYSFGQGNLEFPPPDGQLSGHADNIPTFPPSLHVHLSYSHIQHGENSLRESDFSIHGRGDHGGNTFQMPRFPVPPEPAIRGVSGIPTPDFNQMIPHDHLVSPRSPSPSLPHISSFGESSFESHASNVPAVPQVSLNDHPTFGSIMASAASNISTMNIPQPYVNSQSGTHTESQVTNLGMHRLRETSTVSYDPGPDHDSEPNSSTFLHSFPLSSSDNRLPLNSESMQVSSSHNSFPQALHPLTYAGQVQSTRNSPLTSGSIMPEQHTLSSRLSNIQNLPVENLDGDQQVPNAVMSPASGCSSPNTGNISTPDNRAHSLLRQAVNHDSLQHQVNQTDNMATLQNESSFANSTYIGGELCASASYGVQSSKVLTKQENDNVNPTPGCSSSFSGTDSIPRDRESLREGSDESTSIGGQGVAILSNQKISNTSGQKLESKVKSDKGHSKFSKREIIPSKVKKRLELGDESCGTLGGQRLSTGSSCAKRNVPFFKLGRLWRKQRHRLRVLLPLDISDSSSGEEDVEEGLEENTTKQAALSPVEYNDRQLTRTSPPVFSKNSQTLESQYSSVLSDNSQTINEFDNYENEGHTSRRKTKWPSFVYPVKDSTGNFVNDIKNSTNLAEDFGSKCLSAEMMMSSTGDYLTDESEAKKFTNKLHPFAITSPSFSKSAARAVMTTSVADNATVVTISIMGKGSAAKKGKTKTININKGVIMSSSTGDKDINTYEDRKDVEEDEAPGNAVGTQRTSIMSRLKREKDDVGGQEEEDVVETMEVNVRIDDSQLVQHGEQKRWQCHLCSKSYTTKHNLVAHILDHNGIKPHLCMVCGKYFKQLSHLNTHMLTHDNIRPHICTICGKGFTQISHLKRHNAVHLDSKPYKCDVCSRGFAYPSELKAHKEKHVQGRDKCEECGMEFESPRALKLHQLKHDNREDLICKYCDKAFRYPSQLKDHMVSHEGTRPYICGECGMDFMKEHHLKAHQFTHTGQRPFHCPKCGRTFNQRANMMRHMLIHNPTRAFRCDICGKTFTQPQTLKAHRVVHSDIKPHKCKLCGKQFGRLHNLQGHIHMHNNSKPYVCFCGSSFTLKGNLNRHKKVKHGLNESTESMEEQAVSFLSSLSGQSHAEEAGNSTDYSEFEKYDIEQIASLSDTSSHRKGRKSVIPRKILRHMLSMGKTEENEESDKEEDIEEEEDEDVREQYTGAGMITSDYFSDIKTEDQSQVVGSNSDQEEEMEEEGEEEDNNKERCAGGRENTSEYLSNKKTEAPNRPGGSSQKQQISVNQQKVLRKRKTPCQRVKTEDNPGELSSGQDTEDASDSEWRPASRRGRVKKGAKLDSIIAEKFKNVDHEHKRQLYPVVCNQSSVYTGDFSSG